MSRRIACWREFARIWQSETNVVVRNIVKCALEWPTSSFSVVAPAGTKTTAVRHLHRPANIINQHRPGADWTAGRSIFTDAASSCEASFAMRYRR